MRSFSWKYFTLTGDVDAYMLYKDTNRNDDYYDQEEEPAEEEELTGWSNNGLISK